MHLVCEVQGIVADYKYLSHQQNVEDACVLQSYSGIIFLQTVLPMSSKSARVLRVGEG